MLLDAALLSVIAFQVWVSHRDRTVAAAERDRLVRLATAESRPERLAALLPSPPQDREKSDRPRSPEPAKPEGL